MAERVPAAPAGDAMLPQPGAPLASERLLALAAVAGGVAHDFNNLLLAIQGFSGLAKRVLRAAGGDARVLSYLDEIGIAGERAQLLVQQLSALARARPARLAAGACPAVAGEVVAACAASCAEAVTLAVDVEEGLPAIAIDRAHLHRLWCNLVRNGCEAMPHAGTVLLSARRSRVAAGGTCASCRAAFAGDYVRVAVRDEGHGIALAIRDRVFEPFFGSGSHRSGPGLGLTAVHALVHLAGGHLQIADPPAGGTEMVAFLPLAGEEVADTRP
jgi:signal transduction histidine kinase